MSDVTTRLEIVPIWRRLNEMLVELADHVPDDQLDWSPKPELWGFRRILLHVADARQEWMVRAINDGERDIAGIPERRTRPEIQDALRRTWERVERTLADQARLDATYRDRW